MPADTPTPPQPPLLELAAQLLVTPSALVQLSVEEARQVVRYMQPCAIPAGETFMREGDAIDNDFMLLVLEGEVEIESHDPTSEAGGIVVRVIGQGSLIGELGLLDGLARSVNCVALSDLQAMVLLRADFLRLIEEDPRLGTRLLLAMATRTAARLREITTKFKLFVQMNKAMSAELGAHVNQVEALGTPATGHLASAPGHMPPTDAERDGPLSRYLDWPDAP